MLIIREARASPPHYASRVRVVVVGRKRNSNRKRNRKVEVRQQQQPIHHAVADSGVDGGERRGAAVEARQLGAEPGDGRVYVRDQRVVNGRPSLAARLRQPQQPAARG